MQPTQSQHYNYATAASQQNLSSQYPLVQVGEGYWREKEKVLIPTVKVQAHQCIIANKSAYFAQYFKDHQRRGGDTLTVDFAGQVCYEAFRKIIDYIYLDDHQWLTDQTAAESSSSTEMLEIIKLAKQYKLDALFKACETHFKELMVQSFDCTNLITLKAAQPGQRAVVRKDEPQVVITGAA